MLIAAEELIGCMACLAAGEMDAAAGAAHELALIGARLHSSVRAGTAKRAAHQPYGKHHKQNQHEQATHRAIIYREQKNGGRWSG